MSERKDSPPLQYAIPKPRDHGDGELGALPALLCLLAGLFSFLALLFAGGIAAIVVADAGHANSFQLITGVSLVTLGLLSGWIAFAVNRRYRQEDTPGLASSMEESERRERSKHGNELG